jgi:hypothetical protein
VEAGKGDAERQNQELVSVNGKIIWYNLHTVIVMERIILITITCKKCGASDFYEQNGYGVCRYCQTRFILTTAQTASQNSGITLSDDIKMLLKKCQNDPINASRYAGLVLDIDPSNTEAIKYMK